MISFDKLRMSEANAERSIHGEHVEPSAHAKPASSSMNEPNRQAARNCSSDDINEGRLMMHN